VQVPVGLKNCCDKLSKCMERLSTGIKIFSVFVSVFVFVSGFVSVLVLVFVPVFASVFVSLFVYVFVAVTSKMSCLLLMFHSFCCANHSVTTLNSWSVLPHSAP